jgi:hypothetical protein
MTKICLLQSTYCKSVFGGTQAADSHIAVHVLADKSALRNSLRNGINRWRSLKKKKANEHFAHLQTLIHKLKRAKFLPTHGSKF